MSPHNVLHIPESLGAGRRGQLLARDRGNGLKAQPVVYCWTSGAGWLKATSDEAMKMKAVNHKPMIRPKGTLVLQGGKEVRETTVRCLISNDHFSSSVEVRSMLSVFLPSLKAP